ncbi:MAG: hypothetical protein LW832_09350 [Parachlamydia sp.]|nr:hypothetical protein [Parachlamydia sp.]
MDTKQTDHTSGIQFKEPTEALKEAIVKLETFTQETDGLDVTLDGDLVATRHPPLKRVISLAKCYIGPLLSENLRHQLENKLGKIKQELLHARDILNSHSPLISKLEEGDTQQKTLAQSARCVIERYNAIVTDGAGTGDHEFNFEKRQLLLDAAIKGQTIKLPRTVTISSDSYLPTETTQKTFKELGAAFVGEAAGKKTTFQTTHKKNEQFLRDTFYLKAMRLARSHLPKHYSLAEIMQLIKLTPIQVAEEGDSTLLKQKLDIAPGSSITIMGSFRQYFADLNFLSMPVLNSFRISTESSHSGYPYPSQEAGWTLCERLVDAQPLRNEQLPLFVQLDEKKKAASQKILFDPKMMEKAKDLFQTQRKEFDSHRLELIAKHRKTQELLLADAPYLILEKEPEKALDQFYAHVLQAPSSFDTLSEAQERLLNGFVLQPAKQVEEEWLIERASLLRMGKPSERMQRAMQIFHKQQTAFLSQIDPSDPLSIYIRLMGPLLGNAARSIVLQYLSEKIGFPPPMLNDFERKIQMCAFQHLIRFLDHLEQPLDHTFKGMLGKYDDDLRILQSETIDDLDDPAALITNELEVYFISRSK